MCIVAAIYLDFIAESFERPIISRKVASLLDWTITGFSVAFLCDCGGSNGDFWESNHRLSVFYLKFVDCYY